jgi:hypothetical protein
VVPGAAFIKTGRDFSGDEVFLVNRVVVAADLHLVLLFGGRLGRLDADADADADAAHDRRKDEEPEVIADLGPEPVDVLPPSLGR